MVEINDIFLIEVTLRRNEHLWEEEKANDYPVFHAAIGFEQGKHPWFLKEISICSLIYPDHETLLYDLT
jgi:hypothetical protein